MTAGKGITGGYLPLAATFTTDAIYEAFLGEHADLRTFYHGHSYTGNQLACAVALASLDLFERDRIVERVRRERRARGVGAWPRWPSRRMSARSASEGS